MMLARTTTLAAAASPRLARAYAAQPGSSSFTDRFAKGWNSILSRIKRQEERAATPTTTATAIAPAALDKATSAEAAVRRGTDVARVAAAAKAAAAAAAAKRQLTRPAVELVAPSVALEEALRLAGITHTNLASVSLADAKLKANLLAHLASRSGTRIANVELAAITTARDLLSAATRPSTPLVKHPVAAWFSTKAERGELPPNVQFVPYSKASKRVLG